MPRPGTGQVTERAWKDDGTVTFGARLYAYGCRHRLVFGTNRQGWNRTRAEIELESIQQQVVRGTWGPPERRTTIVQAKQPDPDGSQPFAPFARKVVDAKKSPRPGRGHDRGPGVEARLSDRALRSHAAC